MRERELGVMPELDQEFAHLVDGPLGDPQIRIHQRQAFRRLDHRAEALDLSSASTHRPQA